MTSTNNFHQIKAANSSGDYLALKKAKHIFKSDKNFYNNRTPNHLRERTIGNYMLFNKGRYQNHNCGEVLLFGTMGSTDTLGTGASIVNDFYKDKIITIMNGTAKGDVRKITGYNGSTNVISVNTSFTVNTDNTTVYRITSSVNVFPYNRVGSMGSARPSIVSKGTMTAALTLAADSIPFKDYYKDNIIKITAGSSIGKFSTIQTYSGVSKLITVDPALSGTDNTSIYEIVMKTDNSIDF